MNIGLVAHDAKKKLMQNFCVAYRGILSRHNLYATGTTGRLIEDATGLSVHKFIAGQLGGEQHIEAMIEANQMDLVIFLSDPDRPNPNNPDTAGIYLLCDEMMIPIATNLAMAEMMIKALERGDLDWRNAYR